MSQDIVADALNQMMNAVKAGKKSLILKHYSKMLLSVLAIAKLNSYVKNYKVENKNLLIELDKLNGCKAIKPRYLVRVNEIEKYTARYLPANHLGVIIVSTSKGLVTHHTAQEKNIGGSLIAYMY